MNLLKQPKSVLISLLMKANRLIPDKLYLQLLYYLKMGKPLNLKNPQTFSEKLQWLKLYNRRPEYTNMVDKAAVKDYVASIIGDEFIIPTIGVWDKPEDIDWNSLPNQFVLKTTHGGGSTGVVICRDKKSFNREKAFFQLNKSLRIDSYRITKEWPYKNVPRRIIAEQFIGSNNSELYDYKFFCFNGEPKYCQVISGRSSIECADFFDCNWNHQTFHEPKYLPFSDVELNKPQKYSVMWDLARSLAQNIPFSRIDFYEVDDRVFFGEITFFPTSGMGGFNPESWDYYFGSWITLPEKRC